MPSGERSTSQLDAQAVESFRQQNCEERSKMEQLNLSTMSALMAAAAAAKSASMDEATTTLASTLGSGRGGAEGEKGVGTTGDGASPATLEQSNNTPQPNSSYSSATETRTPKREIFGANNEGSGGKVSWG